jgi:hypothetical protein
LQEAGLPYFLPGRKTPSENLRNLYRSKSSNRLYFTWLSKRTSTQFSIKTDPAFCPNQKQPNICRLEGSGIDTIDFVGCDVPNPLAPIAGATNGQV